MDWKWFLLSAVLSATENLFFWAYLQFSSLYVDNCAAKKPFRPGVVGNLHHVSWVANRRVSVLLSWNSGGIAQLINISKNNKTTQEDYKFMPVILFLRVATVPYSDNARVVGYDGQKLVFMISSFIRCWKALVATACVVFHSSRRYKRFPITGVVFFIIIVDLVWQHPWRTHTDSGASTNEASAQRMAASTTRVSCGRLKWHIRDQNKAPCIELRSPLIECLDGDQYKMSSAPAGFWSDATAYDLAEKPDQYLPCSHYTRS